MYRLFVFSLSFPLGMCRVCTGVSFSIKYIYVQTLCFLCVLPFRYVQSVHWSCSLEQDACFMAAVHQQNVTVWRVSGAVPHLAFKQVRRLNVQPVPQGKTGDEFL